MTDLCEHIELSKIETDFQGFYSAISTDEYRIGFWSDSDRLDVSLKENKLLEYRVFNETTEHKWTRGSIGEKFLYRKLADNEEDTKKKYEEPIEEYQLLDINISKDKEVILPGEVSTSKGAGFFLPIEGPIARGEHPCVRVKYYVPKYDEKDDSTVHAYVKDWRLAGFVMREPFREVW